MLVNLRGSAGSENLGVVCSIVLCVGIECLKSCLLILWIFQPKTFLKDSLSPSSFFIGESLSLGTLNKNSLNAFILF